MSFSFQFEDNNDDIESKSSDHDKSTTLNGSNNVVDAINPLDNQNSITGLEPKVVDLEEVLKSMIDIPISFLSTVIHTNNNKSVSVYKRELFDVKHQLMLEDDNQDNLKMEELENGCSVMDMVMGNDDLKKYIYEGGLKTWEGSLDLIKSLSNTLNDHHAKTSNVSLYFEKFDTFIELGSGTSLPSCYILKQILKNKKNNSNNKKFNFILTDYNLAVLRLVTIPNLIINWYMSLDVEDRNALKSSFLINADINSELQLSNELIHRFLDDSKAKNLNFKFISGSWGRKFLNLLDLQSSENSLILTSETIYSIDVSQILAEILIDLINQNVNNKIFLAAKDIYFGVGGTIIEFINYLKFQNDLHNYNLKFNVSKFTNNGLNRSLLSMSH